MKVTCAFIVMSVCWWAQTDLARGESMPASVQACRSTVDDLQRVRCYDAAVDSSRGKSAPKPSSDPDAAKTVSPVGKLSAKVTELSFRRSGAVNVTLDNGQIWTQYGPEGRVPLMIGDRVTLRPGLFGASVLVGPSGWTTKVHLISSPGTDPPAN
jgi:hypothetical protein